MIVNEQIMIRGKKIDFQNQLVRNLTQIGP